MGKVTKIPTSDLAEESRPALTPEANENMMIHLAMKLAEKQLRDGTASSQVQTHFLKLGTVQAKLELEKLKKENLLLEAKAKAIEASQHSDEIYNKALNAFRRYTGQDEEEEVYD